MGGGDCEGHSGEQAGPRPQGGQNPGGPQEGAEGAWEEEAEKQGPPEEKWSPDGARLGLKALN